MIIGESITNPSAIWKKPGRSRPQSPTSAPLIRKKLAVEHDSNSIASRVWNALDISAEVDGAHDPISELLVDQRLQRRPVNLDQLVQPVDRRIDG